MSHEERSRWLITCGIQVLCLLFAAIQAFPEMKNGNFAGLGVVIFFLLCLSIVVSVALLVHAMRQHPAGLQSQTAPFVGSSTASKPLPDTQLKRWLGRQQAVVITLGELRNVSETGAASGSKTLAIELKAIEEERRPGPYAENAPAEPCARLTIDFGGVVLYVGPESKEVGVNEFQLFKPRRTADEHAVMAYHTYLGRYGFEFIAVHVKHINIHARTVELVVTGINVSDADLKYT